MPIKKSVAIFLAALLFVSSTATPSQALFGRKIVKLAVGAAAADWAFVAGTAAVETAIALRSAQLGSMAIGGLTRLLAAHTVLGPRAVYISLTKRILEDPSLFPRAVAIVSAIGLEVGQLEAKIKEFVEAATPPPDKEPKDPQDECEGLDDRGGNDGLYDPHAIKEAIMQRFQLPDGSVQISPDTIPNPSHYNVGKAISNPSGLVVHGIPFDVRGFPIFDGVSVVDLRIVDRVRFASVDSKTQLAMATRELRSIINAEAGYTGNWSEKLLEYYNKGEIGYKFKFSDKQLAAIKDGAGKIPGYTWHHHQDFTRMQLVPTDIHSKVGHIGGWNMHICRMLKRKIP
ncbi:HNH endonuclease [Methylobacterium brachiatum]